MTAQPNLEAYADLIPKVESGERWLSEVSADPPKPRLLGRWDPSGLSQLVGQSGIGKGMLMGYDMAELVRQGHRPLLVDYENHPDEYARRIVAIAGRDVAEEILVVTPLDRERWKGSAGPLWDIAPRLAELVRDTDRTVMVIDSLTPACMGMAMNDPDTPQRFTEATVEICPITIAIGQVNRAGDLSAPFGSGLWKYWSRAVWSAERAPGQTPDGQQRVLLTDRKANNYATADRMLLTVEWRDGLPVSVDEQAYALALADQIEVVLGMEQKTVGEIVDELNADVDEDRPEVKADSVRKALRRGSLSSPPRFAVSGKGSTAKWSI